MKLDSKVRFPHPVLWVETNDFAEKQFASSIEIDESLKTGELTVKYTHQIDEPAIVTLIESGAATTGFFITCMETYFSSLLATPYPSGRLQIPGGKLRGRVVVRPLVWSNNLVRDLHSSSLHVEFKDGISTIAGASVIALGEEFAVNVGREKLAKIESIFALTRIESVPVNQFEVLLEDEAIQIAASTPTYDRIHALRFTTHGKAFLLNAIYLPAVMSVLSSISEDDSLFEGKRWHRVFTATLDHLGIDRKSQDYLKNAQQLMRSPFGRVSSLAEVHAP
jgi:hypothetical protein